MVKTRSQIRNQNLHLHLPIEWDRPRIYNPFSGRTASSSYVRRARGRWFNKNPKGTPISLRVAFGNRIQSSAYSRLYNVSQQYRDMWGGDRIPFSTACENAAQHFVEQLPSNFNGMVKLEYSFQDASKLVKSVKKTPLIDMPSHMVIKTKQPDHLSKVLDHEYFCGHEMTLLGKSWGIHENGTFDYGSYENEMRALRQFIPPENKLDQRLSNVSNLVRNFLLNRAKVDEHYNSNIYLEYTESPFIDTDANGEALIQEHEDPTFIRLTAIDVGYETAQISLGQAKSWMKNKMLPLSEDAKSEDGLCVPAAIIHHCHNKIPIVKNRAKHNAYHLQDMYELASQLNMLNSDNSIKKYWKLQDIIRINETAIQPSFNRISGKKANRSMKAFKLQIAVLSSNGDVIHLPPHADSVNDRNWLIPVIMCDGHCTNFADNNTAYKIIQDQLEKFQACVRFSYQSKELELPDNVYIQAWNLFRTTQENQPCSELVNSAINTHLETSIDFTEDLKPVYKKIGGVMTRKWKTKFEGKRYNDILAKWMRTDGEELYYSEKPGRKSYPATWNNAVRGVVNTQEKIKVDSIKSILKAKGVGDVICNFILEYAPWEFITKSKNTVLPEMAQYAVDVVKSNVIKQEGVKSKVRKWEESNQEPFPYKLSDPNAREMLNNMPAEFPKIEFDINNWVAFDIETASCSLEPGIFKTYAAQLRHKSENGVHIFSHVVKNVSELVDNSCMRNILTELQRIEADRPRIMKKDVDQTPPLYACGHNISKFDSIEVLSTAFQSEGFEVTDLLKSNGRVITFKIGNIKFIDSFLLTMGSLSDVAKSLGLQTQKLSLPHKYLQNCPTWKTVIDRLHGTVKWADLEQYMDFFESTKMSDLQKRIPNRTHQEWVESQGTYKEWVKVKDVSFNFCEQMLEYLDADVQIVLEIVDKIGHNCAKDYGIHIGQKMTVGSHAVHIWSHLIDRDIPKLTRDQAERWGEVNRGGFCSPMHHFYLKCDDGSFIAAYDVTSLYPSCMRKPKWNTDQGEYSPLEEYYQGFPDITSGFKMGYYDGKLMDKEMYNELKPKIGIARVKFDQSACKAPVLLSKLEHGTNSALTYVMEHEGWFTIPQIRQAFDYGVKLWVYDVEYTLDSFEPFERYVSIFEKMKNEADKGNKELEKTVESDWTQSMHDQYDKNLYIRTYAKLMLNSLPGRLNLQINRKQTLLTQDPSDIIPLIGDTERYNIRELEELTVGGTKLIKAVYNEGDYEYHIEKFNVAPHLSGYMLGYSKMLMVESFQMIAEIGATPLYTDTDSIKIHFKNEEQHELYKKQFVPKTKTFGGMECEGRYTEMRTCGPKKAAYKYADGSYTWVGNGIRARENTNLDVWQMYSNVLDGKVETIQDFNIRATKDLQLIHTDGATKKLRFLMTKGKVIGESDSKIQWWKNTSEFEDYCNSIVPMGMAECWDRYKTVSDTAGRCPHKDVCKASQVLQDELKAYKKSTLKPVKSDDMLIDNVLSKILPDANCDEITGRQIKESVKIATGIEKLDVNHRKRIREQTDHFMNTGDIKKQKSDDICYILQCIQHPQIGYIGVTNNMQRRIEEHNNGKCEMTSGNTWQIMQMYSGFTSRNQALQFESAVSRHGNGREKGPLEDLVYSLESTLCVPYYKDITRTTN